jgi:hypothetical protein
MGGAASVTVGSTRVATPVVPATRTKKYSGGANATANTVLSSGFVANAVRYVAGVANGATTKPVRTSRIIQTPPEPTPSRRWFASGSHGSTCGGTTDPHGNKAGGKRRERGEIARER